MEVLMRSNLSEYIGQAEVDDILRTAEMLAAGKVNVSYGGHGVWNALVMNEAGEIIADKSILEKPGAAGGWNNKPQAVRTWNMK
jgi:hypothetical protein